MTILNGFLFLCCVMLFNLACISLLFGMFPITLFLLFLFSVCYWAIKYDGPKPKQIHLTYFNGDTEKETEDYTEPPFNGDTEKETEDYTEPPFNRDNFKFN